MFCRSSLATYIYHYHTWIMMKTKNDWKSSVIRSEIMRDIDDGEEHKQKQKTILTRNFYVAPPGSTSSNWELLESNISKSELARKENK